MLLCYVPIMRSTLFMLRCLNGHLPHVDQVLSQSHRVGISGDRNGPVCARAPLAVFAVRDSYHRAADLSETVAKRAYTVIVFRFFTLKKNPRQPWPLEQQLTTYDRLKLTIRILNLGLA